MLLVELGLTEKKKRWMILGCPSFASTLFPQNGVCFIPGNIEREDLIHQDKKMAIFSADN